VSLARKPVPRHPAPHRISYDVGGPVDEHARRGHMRGARALALARSHVRPLLAPAGHPRVAFAPSALRPRCGRRGRYSLHNSCHLSTRTVVVDSGSNSFAPSYCAHLCSYNRSSYKSSRYAASSPHFPICLRARRLPLLLTGRFSPVVWGARVPKYE